MNGILHIFFVLELQEDATPWGFQTKFVDSSLWRLECHIQQTNSRFIKCVLCRLIAISVRKMDI